MAKRVIQVPVDEKLLKDLDSLSKKQHKARSELIRQACLSFLQQVEDEELDRIYRQGYMRIPEEPGTGEIQVAMSGEFISRESW
jgi:metal-responsive CopG/Arc/MetJ family transcriptional regulator